MDHDRPLGGLPLRLMAGAPFEVVVAASGDYADVTTLMREYVAWLPFDVSSFQDVERELADVSADYGPPGGIALLAKRSGEPIGVVGVRPFSDGVAELKRMWVRPVARGLGVGHVLASRAIVEARTLGYRTLRLDTVVGVMEGANRLYESMGFRDIPAYRSNPLDGARFMELDLM